MPALPAVINYSFKVIMIKNWSGIFSLLILALTFGSWGGLGHRTISFKSVESFPAAMNDFKVWNDSLSLHASDADNRKSSDSNESPKHFLDIENYQEYLTKGRIYSTYDSLVNKYGSSVVINNGTLPWATQNTYDLLVSDFRNLKWHQAMIDASDLGHYVADGHMPLHISANYDGQQTGNRGIHSRYESDMVYANISQLSAYSGSPVNFVSNVNSYIFNYIYNNHRYVDSILIADNYSKSVDSYYGTPYYNALWSKTKFTTTLFKNASHSLAELIYTAWVNAGSPPYKSTTLPNGVTSNSIQLVNAYPNPCTGIFNLAAEGFVKAEVFSLTGELNGTYFQKRIDMSNAPKGVYIMKVYLENQHIQQIKIILTD